MTGTRLSSSVNNMVVDGLGTQGARASAAVVLNQVPWNIPV